MKEGLSRLANKAYRFDPYWTYAKSADFACKNINRLTVILAGKNTTRIS